MRIYDSSSMLENNAVINVPDICHVIIDADSEFWKDFIKNQAKCLLEALYSLLQNYNMGIFLNNVMNLLITIKFKVN